MITLGHCCEQKLLLRSFYGERFRACNHAVLPALSQGKLSEAEPLYARCQPVEERVVGQKHARLAVALHHRGVLLSPCFSAAMHVMSAHPFGNVS